MFSGAVPVLFGVMIWSKFPVSVFLCGYTY